MHAIQVPFKDQSVQHPICGDLWKVSHSLELPMAVLNSDRSNSITHCPSPDVCGCCYGPQKNKSNPSFCRAQCKTNSHYGSREKSEANTDPLSLGSSHRREREEGQKPLLLTLQHLFDNDTSPQEKIEIYFTQKHDNLLTLLSCSSVEEKKLFHTMKVNDDLFCEFLFLCYTREMRSNRFGQG